MLVYDNADTIRLVFQVTGSVVYRGKVWAIAGVIALIAFVLQTFRNEVIEHLPEIPTYVMQYLGAIITFSVVFRTNLAWGRYWEAITQLHVMYHKLLDSFSQFDAFACATMQNHLSSNPVGTAATKVRKLQSTRDLVQRDFALLSAMACDRLHKADISRMSRRAEMKATWSQRISFREDLIKCDLVGAKSLPSFHVDRSGRATTNYDLKNRWDVAYLMPSEPTKSQLKFLEDSEDRPAVVVSWINLGLARACADLGIPPPIQSRMYQELSNGMVGFNNVMKIADVPFPLPYAQLMAMLLWSWTLLIPIYVMMFVKSRVAGPIVALLMFASIWCANLLAMELENPVSGEANDISALDFHDRFVDAICTVAKSGQATLDGELNLESDTPCVVAMPRWRSREAIDDTEGKASAVSRV